MVYYKLVKMTIDAPRLAKFIIDKVVWNYSLFDSIVLDRSLFFTPKFWSLLCYFLGIKCQLLIIFYLETNGQIKRQNSNIKVYFKAFVNFEQNN